MTRDGKKVNKNKIFQPAGMADRQAKRAIIFGESQPKLNDRNGNAIRMKIFMKNKIAENSKATEMMGKK